MKPKYTRDHNEVQCIKCHCRKSDAIGMRNNYCFRCLLNFNGMEGAYMNREIVYTGSAVVTTEVFFRRNSKYITKWSQYSCRRCKSTIIFDDLSHCCGHVYYCNIKCEREDWSRHKHLCYRY